MTRKGKRQNPINDEDKDATPRRGEKSKQQRANSAKESGTKDSQQKKLAFAMPSPTENPAVITQQSDTEPWKKVQTKLSFAAAVKKSAPNTNANSNNTAARTTPITPETRLKPPTPPESPPSSPDKPTITKKQRKNLGKKTQQKIRHKTNQPIPKNKIKMTTQSKAKTETKNQPPNQQQNKTKTNKTQKSTNKKFDTTALLKPHPANNHSKTLLKSSKNTSKLSKKFSVKTSKLRLGIKNRNYPDLSHPSTNQSTYRRPEKA